MCTHTMHTGQPTGDVSIQISYPQAPFIGELLVFCTESAAHGESLRASEHGERASSTGIRAKDRGLVRQMAFSTAEELP